MTNGLRLLFPVPLWEAYIGDEEMNQSLKTAIYDIEKNDTQFKQNDYPCGYSSYINKISLVNDTRFKDLTCKVLIEAKKFLTVLKIKKQAETHLSLCTHDLFCNINRQYSVHGPHRHECSDLSAVYYVDANEDSAPFICHSPAETLFMHMRTDLYEKDSLMINEHQIILPKTSKVLIFPSWMTHSIGQQLTERDRVSIAFNFGLVTRKK